MHPIIEMFFIVYIVLSSFCKSSVFQYGRSASNEVTVYDTIQSIHKRHELVIIKNNSVHPALIPLVISKAPISNAIPVKRVISCA